LKTLDYFQNHIILKTCDYFQNININVVFLLNNFLFIFKTPIYICTALVEDFISLYMQKKIFYLTIYDSRCYRIWKTRDHFQNINIIVLFLQNTVKYLHLTHCRIYVLISTKSNFMYTDMRKLIWLNFENKLLF